MKSIMNWLTNAKEANEEGKRGETLLERAKHLQGKHNQTAHGYRLSKTPSLETARRYRKEGLLSDFTNRARARQGTKPAKDRNAERPKVPRKKTLTQRDYPNSVSAVGSSYKINRWQKENRDILYFQNAKQSNFGAGFDLVNRQWVKTFQKRDFTDKEKDALERALELTE